MLASKNLKKTSLTLRIQAMLWLVFTLILMVLTILLWIYSKSPVDEVETEQAVTEAEIVLLQEINKEQAIDTINDLTYYVKPVKFRTIIRDLRKYPDEFKDEKFLSDNKSKWSLEIMNVEQHEVITDYLNAREDRDKFVYFRHTNDNNRTTYTLVYGLTDDAREARSFLQEVDFRLPTSVKVIPKSIQSYVEIVDNYVIAEEVFDLSGNRPREVKLLPTRRLLPVKHPKAKAVPKPDRTTQTVNKKNDPSRSVKDKTSKAIKTTEDKKIKPPPVIEQHKILQEALE